jgi:hypothetical protein
MTSVRIEEVGVNREDEKYDDNDEKYDDNDETYDDIFNDVFNTLLEQQAKDVNDTPSLLDQLVDEEAKEHALLNDAAKETVKAQKENGCIVCFKWTESADNPLLMCDKVQKRGRKRKKHDALCHLKCCTPALTKVPSGPWYCEACR